MQEQYLRIITITATTAVSASAVLAIIFAAAGLISVPERKFEPMWWNKGMIYQIYPRTFMDSNNDGVGDIKGIIKKLHYLKWLGVKTIWLLPHFESPLNHAGYDVTGYWRWTQVDRDNAEVLVREVKKQGDGHSTDSQDTNSLHTRDLKPLTNVHQELQLYNQNRRGEEMYIIMSIPVSYTSSDHFWFRLSMQDAYSQYKEFYFWSTSKAPLQSNSTTSGAIWSKRTSDQGEFYLSMHQPELPMLNYGSEALNEEMDKVIAKWLDIGVDGIVFEEVSDTSVSLMGDPGRSSYDKVKQWCKMIKQYATASDRSVISVLNPVFSRDLNAKAFQDSGCDIVVSPAMLNIERNVPSNRIAMLLSNWLSLETSDILWTLESPLHQRMRTRLKRDNNVQIENLIMLLTWLPGIPSILYGSEIGLGNLHTRDVRGIENNNVKKGLLSLPSMPWSTQNNAGFNDNAANLFMPFPADYQDHNIASMMSNFSSFLYVIKDLLELRRNVLQNENRGKPAIKFLSTYSEAVLAFVRIADEVSYLVAINIGTSNGTSIFDLSDQLDSDASTVFFACGPQANVLYPVGRVVLLNRLSMTNGQGIVLKLKYNE